jgi:FkbM family methyltransferase
MSIYRRIFARRFFFRINKVLFDFSLRGLGVLNYETEKLSGEDYFLHKLLPTIINKERPVLFDVGANVGDYSKSLREEYPNARIYAFEPHPRTFSYLKSNLASSNVKLYNIALGENPGEFVLYDRADQDGSQHASLFEAVISEIHKQNTTKFSVTVDTMDEFCRREEISEIDFLKIDTEGNELQVLNGAKELITNMRLSIIQFEFNEMNVVSRVFLRDFRQLLRAYDVFRLLPQGLLPLDNSSVWTEIFAYQNIVAIRKKGQ